jgi:release factor glutamine methyltransferase
MIELGSGSGIISIYASRKGAVVTAIDINKKAVRNTLENNERNQTRISVLESDLFDNLLPASFDWIIVNPPYYPVNPKNDEEYAWNCGADHQYFEKLFTGLSKFITPESQVLMILSDVCDLKAIFSISLSNGFKFEKILERKVWADGQNYLYWIKPI